MNTCRKCNEPCVGKRRKFCSAQCSKQFFSEQQKQVNQTAQGKAKVRNSSLKSKYGITSDQFLEILASQNNVCKICKKPPKDGKWLCVDHNHNNLVVRDLLCSTCNLLIGLAKESPEILTSATEYIHLWRNENNPELINGIRFKKEQSPKEAETTKVLSEVSEQLRDISNMFKYAPSRNGRSDSLDKLLRLVQQETEGMANNDLPKFLLSAKDRRSESEFIRDFLGLKKKKIRWQVKR